MSFISKYLAFFFIICSSTSLVLAKDLDPIVIIVHPDNKINRLPKIMIRKIYEGKKRFWNPGNLIFLCDLKRHKETRLRFSQNYLQKTPTQMAQLYLRMAITGKGTSPQTLSSIDKMLEIVSQNPSAIGYAPKSLVTPKVRILDIL